ncbi:MAG TPA: secondary thiamine-phosphate synthase enzyme YjbQ, partial [Longimicrobiales bacterium]|nr:secondary thiamine-phosphate synthase enzyme YjbQ [Longimicrobiales bacterium]
RMIGHVEVPTSGQGLSMITREIQRVVGDSGVEEGLCTLMIRHTSASLTIQENADPSAARDLEGWLDRHVPEDDPHFTHTAEGPDDMPSHIKAALTSTTLSIPVDEGRLALGTWQGIYLWEHRRRGRVRRCVIHLGE